MSKTVEADSVELSNPENPWTPFGITILLVIQRKLKLLPVLRIVLLFPASANIESSGANFRWVERPRKPMIAARNYKSTIPSAINYELEILAFYFQFYGPPHRKRWWPTPDVVNFGSAELSDPKILWFAFWISFPCAVQLYNSSYNYFRFSWPPCSHAVPSFSNQPI